MSATSAGGEDRKPVIDWRKGRAKPRLQANGGFTLLEVTVALVLGTVGLMGTVAIQQTMFNASANAGDAAIATRLALRAMEEYDIKVVAAGPPIVDQLAVAATSGWSTSSYMNPLGSSRAQQTPDFRFKREVLVSDPGPARPYSITVQITYALDSGVPRTVRLDSQRNKTW